MNGFMGRFWGSDSNSKNNNSSSSNNKPRPKQNNNLPENQIIRQSSITDASTVAATLNNRNPNKIQNLLGRHIVRVKDAAKNPNIDKLKDFSVNEVRSQYKNYRNTGQMENESKGSIFSIFGAEKHVFREVKTFELSPSNNSNANKNTIRADYIPMLDHKHAWQRNNSNNNDEISQIQPNMNKVHQSARDLTTGMGISDKMTGCSMARLSNNQMAHVQPFHSAAKEEFQKRAQLNSQYVANKKLKEKMSDSEFKRMQQKVTDEVIDIEAAISVKPLLPSANKLKRAHTVQSVFGPGDYGKVQDKRVNKQHIETNVFPMKDEQNNIRMLAQNVFARATYAKSDWKQVDIKTSNQLMPGHPPRPLINQMGNNGNNLNSNDNAQQNNELASINSSSATKKRSNSMSNLNNNNRLQSANHSATRQRIHSVDSVSSNNRPKLNKTPSHNKLPLMMQRANSMTNMSSVAANSNNNNVQLANNPPNIKRTKSAGHL